MSKSIKGKTASTMEYTGIVTLSQYTNGKKLAIASIKNSGGKSLFDFLANCLVGDYTTANSDRPSKILLLNVSDDDNIISAAKDATFIRLLSNPEKVYSSEVEGIVRYSFIIPQEQFVGTKFNAIGLYTNTKSIEDVEDYAAFCKIDLSTTNLLMSSVLVLDWELHISN